jgi:GNAT superfamily N-acetyltransferase
MIRIQPLDLTRVAVAERVIAMQRRAYAIEARLIGFAGIPPLHEPLAALQATDERFLGADVDGTLAGAVAYASAGATLDITRMMVDPDYHRRGIARALLLAVFEVDPNARTFTVSTGAANAPAIALYTGMGFWPDYQEKLAAGVWIAHFVMRA